jgi:hypothetical protein
MTHSRASGAILLAGMAATALLLAGCTQGTAGLHAPPSIAQHTTSTSAATPDAADSVTCTALSIMWSNVQGAMIQHTNGTMNDGEYAAVVNTVPTTLFILDQEAISQKAGLGAEIGNLRSVLSISTPTVAGAKFDPANSAFSSEMGKASALCKEGGSEIIVRDTVSGG